MSSKKSAFPTGPFLIDSIARTIQDGCKYGCIAVIAWCSKESIASLAGKITLADLSLLVNLPTGEKENLRPLVIGIGVGALGLLSGASGVIYGYFQRRLRLEVADLLGNRNKQLELITDPKRTSSNLNRKGLSKRGD